jgi:hypothetical protein
VTRGGFQCQNWLSQTPHQHNSISGIQHSAWLDLDNDQTPDYHDFGGLGDHNFCRNPDGKSGGAWCFVVCPPGHASAATGSDGLCADAANGYTGGTAYPDGGYTALNGASGVLRWDYCDVPDCLASGSRGCYDSSVDTYGRTYRGAISHTATGKTCQAWHHISPWPGSVNNHIFAPASFGTNSAGLGNHNFCRNPNSRGSGPWCYLADPNESTCSFADPLSIS